MLKGSELDTDCGHFLVFGVNKLLLNEVDFSDIKMSGVELARIAKDSGAIAIPAHPGRYGVGLVNYLDDGLDLSNITIVEALNGSARAGENEKSAEISINLNPLYRDKKISKPFLEVAILYFRKIYKIPIIAEIKITNAPSIKSFEDIGFKKITGFGGLPVGVSEKAVSLLSSGIDSPVSSFEMIKRGVDVDYIHFHSYPATSMQSIDNVKKILNVLACYQLKSNLFLVPLLDIQQSLMAIVPD